MSKTIPDECELTLQPGDLTIRTTGNNDQIILTASLTSDQAAILVYLAQGSSSLEVTIKEEGK